jgi:hypothetical protein
LIKLPERGLPFFVPGLTYAVNRLRQYRGPVRRKILSGNADIIDKLCIALQRYAGFVDITRPILTFAGSNPLKPSLRPM